MKSVKSQNMATKNGKRTNSNNEKHETAKAKRNVKRRADWLHFAPIPPHFEAKEQEHVTRRESNMSLMGAATVLSALSLATGVAHKGAFIAPWVLPGGSSGCCRCRPDTGMIPVI